MPDKEQEIPDALQKAIDESKPVEIQGMVEINLQNEDENEYEHWSKYSIEKLQDLIKEEFAEWQKPLPYPGHPPSMPSPNSFGIVDAIAFENNVDSFIAYMVEVYGLNYDDFRRFSALNYLKKIRAIRRDIGPGFREQVASQSVGINPGALVDAHGKPINLRRPT